MNKELFEQVCLAYETKGQEGITDVLWDNSCCESTSVIYWRLRNVYLTVTKYEFHSFEGDDYKKSLTIEIKEKEKDEVLFSKEYPLKPTIY